MTNLQTKTTNSIRAAKQSAVVQNASQMIEYLQKTHATNLHLDYINHIRTYASFELSTINIDRIDSDRVDLDAGKLEAYSLLDDQTVPPVVVADGVILDGYHRVTVAKSQGKTSVAAWIGLTV